MQLRREVSVIRTSWLGKCFLWVVIPEVLSANSGGEQVKSFFQ
jgi:hypothetical protein